MVRTAMLGLLCTGVLLGCTHAPSQSASGAAAPGAPAKRSQPAIRASPPMGVTTPIVRGAWNVSA